MRKKIVGAFFWDAPNAAISFMILDGCYKTLYLPRKFSLYSLSLPAFKNKSEKIIKLFFKSILQLYHQHPSCDIKIEYKIVHQVSKDLEDFYQPSERSAYVRKVFLRQYALIKSQAISMKLSQQLRTRLRRPELDIFKKGLKDLQLVNPSRTTYYQYHLWILATHATKANYQKILKRLAKYSVQNAA